MKLEDRQELYGKTLEKWGERAQLEMAQEEATELALAVRKHIRNPREKTFQDLASEIADAEIMIEQMDYMMGTSLRVMVEEQKNYKLNRLKERVG